MRFARTALLCAGVLALAHGYVWPAASGQGHCAEAVAFLPSADASALQLAQRKTDNVCGKHDPGKNGAMPAVGFPLTNDHTPSYDRA